MRCTSSLGESSGLILTPSISHRLLGIQVSNHYMASMHRTSSFQHNERGLRDREVRESNNRQVF
ncbi:hypothetical protein BVRB_3g065390 [Beta vulgaris subsp. vulgaris]|uniref:Uncharacterized protein n=1 Tax=Beta vulgaris subsp. vulgaris TaxID=3555 RepID=A0A0J8CRZ2_BETVV|nr:hypothetical protein BVRB_3g065390 [Beta vulgaris subsp. vulgaris]